MRPAFLQEDEEPLLVQRRHPLSALDSWIGILALLVIVCGGAFAVAAFVDARAVPYSVAIAVVAVVLASIAALAVWFRVNTSLDVVTAERVYHTHGKFRFFLSQTTYDRVTDLHVHQSVFGRRLGFGNVLVQTAGQGVALLGVRDPLATKRAIEEAREGMVRRLVGAHKPARASASATKNAAKTGNRTPASEALPGVRPGGRMGGPPLWTGGPTLASLLSQVIPTMLFFIPFVLFSGFATFKAGPVGLLLPAGLLLIAGLLVASVLIRLRTTHYEVHGWGVALSRGWLSRTRVEARYEKVTDVAVTQGIWGRMFGFGSIRINTAGSNEAPIAFEGVRDPDQVKAAVDRARHGGTP